MIDYLKPYCSQEWLDFVDFHKTTQDFSKNSTLFNKGDQVNGIFFIIEGKAKVVQPLDKKKERLLRLASKGDILGHRGFGKNWFYPVSAIALTNIQVDYLPIPVFQQLLKGNPELAYHLILFFAEELKNTEARTREQDPVKTRVARALLANLDAFGTNGEVPGMLAYTLKRQDLANYAGTTYETVIRVLGDLAQQEIIKLHGKKIQVLDEEGLSEGLS